MKILAGIQYDVGTISIASIVSNMNVAGKSAFSLVYP